jgi:hypothetical protein
MRNRRGESPDLDRDPAKGSTRTPQPGVELDSNVSAWSRLSVAAVHTCMSILLLHWVLHSYTEAPGHGGSRISYYHRAGILALEGCSLVHSVLTPLTIIIPVSGLRNTHRIVLSF